MRKKLNYFGFGRVTSAKKSFVSIFFGLWLSFIICNFGPDNKLPCWFPINEDDEKPDFDDEADEEEDDDENDEDDDEEDENADDIALFCDEAFDIDELASFFIEDIDKPGADDSLFSKLNDSCLEDINFDELWPFAVLLWAVKLLKNIKDLYNNNC